MELINQVLESKIAKILFFSQNSARSKQTHQTTFGILLCFTLLTSVSGPVIAASTPIRYDLDRAIATALENNRLRTISQQSLAIAEAQYQQAASSYWPSLSLNAGFQRRDEATIFNNPVHKFDLDIPIANMSIPVTVPDHDITMLGRDTRLYSLEMTYPLYTGGKRSSLIEQAKLGIDIASKEVHRTDLQVVQDVKRYYYAALYTQQLAALAEDITLSFEALRDITQTFFEGGSRSVNKLDLLHSKLAHTMAAATLADISSRHESALAALTFTMGLDWREEIQLGSDAYPAGPDTISMDRLIEQALEFNPEIEKLALVVDAYEAKVEEAKSGYYPIVAFAGSVDSFDSGLNSGLDNEANRHSWKIGIGMQMNLFDGGRTRHKVSAAKTEQAKKEQQLLLVSDAVATQVKSLFLQIQAAQNQIEITQQAVATSRENRDLAKRAYQTGAVETQKVVEANLIDAMIRSNLYRAMHDQALHLAEISYLLGKETMQ